MKKRYLIVTISLVCVAAVLIAATVILLLNSSKGNDVKKDTASTPDESVAAEGTAALAAEDPSADEDTILITEAPRETDGEEAEASTAEDETREEAPDTAPDEMTAVLAQTGDSVEELAALGCTQLVTVSSSGSTAQIRFYELEDGEWTADDSLACSGYVGSNGVTSDMHEGGRATPGGLYHIGEAFYIYDRPDTGLNTFEVTSDTYWVDDPDSAYYNKRVTGTADKDWDSAEHMIDYTTAYEYGFVIEYNTQAVYNAGSAIFFHVSYNSTAGCVGTDRAYVLSYLSKLDASKNPYIIIV